MKKLILIIVAIFCVGCMGHAPGERKRAEGTIGPCYGSIRVSADVNGCLYDTDYDEIPDIVLFHYWDGEKMVLVMARTIEEVNAMEYE